MATTFPFIPWNTHVLWTEANASLARAVQRNRPALVESRHLAHRLQAHLTAVFPRMDELCTVTCPACTDICCRHACVWIDFRDLLFLHLAGIPEPTDQMLSRPGEHCRYGSPQGCLLERIQRPFICTWYLCPAQTRSLRSKPAQLQQVTDCLQQIKTLRRKMELSFIRAVA